jgi:hypothetical protein
MAISNSQLSIVTVTFPSWLERLGACSFGFAAQEQSARTGFFEPPASDAICLVIRGELAIGAELRATHLYSVDPMRIRTMMQSYASAAKLRDGGPIL